MKSWEWNPKLWVFEKKVCGCILIGNSLRKKLSHHTKTKRFNLFVISKVAASFIGFLHYCIMRNFLHKKTSHSVWLWRAMGMETPGFCVRKIENTQLFVILKISFCPESCLWMKFIQWIRMFVFYQLQVVANKMLLCPTRSDKTRLFSRNKSVQVSILQKFL